MYKLVHYHTTLHYLKLHVWYLVFLGALFDKTMTYNATYFLAGACVLVAAVLTVITFIIVRNKDNEDELNDSQEDQRINETIPEEDEGGDSKA